MTATELYVYPLQETSFTLGEVVVKLEKGLAATIRLIEKWSDRDVRAAAKFLGAVSRKLDRLRLYVAAYTQVRWYAAKGAPVPIGVAKTLERVKDEVMSAEETPTPVTDNGDAVVPVKRTPGGTRPYCRSLIEAGELDEKVLLVAVNEKFPERKFVMADVRGCLRNAGKLPWTPRKGMPRKEKKAE